MLYDILKPLVTLALKLYFRRISRSKLEYIDNGKPTLILANHTASFMDAILVACFVKRRIHFFARGDVFGNKWADKILRSIGLLPIYRLSEGRDKLHLNDNSNDSALEILSKGGAVLIFCEGTSDIAKRLKPLKKGPFRLAATAAATLPEPPLIVPLGINYITPTAPGGDVFLLAAAPKSTKEHLSGSDEASRAKAATEMMRQTDSALLPLTWHTTKPHNTPISDQVLQTLQATLKHYTFRQSQQVLNKLNTADETLIAELSRSAINSKPVIKTPSTGKPALGNALLLILLSPIAMVGWLFHTLLMRAAKSITYKRVSSPDFYAPVFLSIALPLTILWYMILTIVATQLHPTWLWLTAVTVIAICGIIYLKWYNPLLQRTISSFLPDKQEHTKTVEQFIRSALNVAAEQNVS